MSSPLDKNRIKRVLQVMSGILLDQPEESASADINQEVARDYQRLLDVVSVVHAGGARAMLYRLETGRRTLSSDYFDEITHRLKEQRFPAGCEPSSSLLEMVRSITLAEEQLVRKMLPEIESLVMLARERHALLLVESDAAKDDSPSAEPEK